MLGARILADESGCSPTVKLVFSGPSLGSGVIVLVWNVVVLGNKNIKLVQGFLEK